jgi:hypothetical protein
MGLQVLGSICMSRRGKGEERIHVCELVRRSSDGPKERRGSVRRISQNNVRRDRWTLRRGMRCLGIAGAASGFQYQLEMR